MTPKMFEIEQEIMRLRKRFMADPNDHMLSFEIDELVNRYDILAKFEKLGLKLLLGGLHSSNTSTLTELQLANKEVDEA